MNNKNKNNLKREAAARRALIALTATVMSSAGAAVAKDADLSDTEAESAVVVRSPWGFVDHAPVVGMLVQEDVSAFEALRCRPAVTIVEFPLEQDFQVNLELEQFWVTDNDTQFIVAGDGGEERIEAPEVATFRGYVAGYEDSWVFLGVTPTEVQGVVRLSEGVEYVISTPRPSQALDQDRLPMIFERFATKGLFSPPVWNCDPEESPEAVPMTELLERAEAGGVGDDGDDETISGYTWKVLDLAIDCDWEFRNLFGSVNETAAYATLLTAAASSIYERDMELKIALHYIRVWNTSNDPYTMFTTATALPEFRDYWNANMGGVGRAFAHLLSAKDMGGGRAYIQGLCNNSSYGVDGNMTGAFPYPLEMNSDENWDIIVFIHEMGHNIGTHHTHCYDPPLDRCYNEEGDCYNGSEVCQVGTIMSYCHTCSGGLSNMTLQFHSSCIVVMRTYVDGRSCPVTARNPCYVNGAYNGTERGTNSQPFNTVFEGAKYVIPGGTIRITPGTYSTTFPVWYPLNRPMTLNTNGNGTVVIGQQ